MSKVDKTRYCPYCEKYVCYPYHFCPFCSSNVILLSLWTQMNDEDKKNWMDKWPMHNPPEKTWGTDLEEEEKFDAQYRAELAAEEARKQYVPHCPTCGCPDLEKVGAGEKLASIAVWGVFSKKPRVQFRCKNCGYEW